MPEISTHGRESTRSLFSSRMKKHGPRFSLHHQLCWCWLLPVDLHSKSISPRKRSEKGENSSMNQAFLLKAICFLVTSQGLYPPLQFLTPTKNRRKLFRLREVRKTKTTITENRFRKSSTVPDSVTYLLIRS